MVLNGHFHDRTVPPDRSRRENRQRMSSGNGFGFICTSPSPEVVLSRAEAFHTGPAPGRQTPLHPFRFRFKVKSVRFKVKSDHLHSKNNAFTRAPIT